MALTENSAKGGERERLHCGDSYRVGAPHRESVIKRTFTANAGRSPPTACAQAANMTKNMAFLDDDDGGGGGGGGGLDSIDASLILFMYNTVFRIACTITR